MDSNMPMHRYAWLEEDEGIWIFLTDLFAAPSHATRRWLDKLDALEELEREGWSIVAPYPHAIAGYGLIRTLDTPMTHQVEFLETGEVELTFDCP